jgi:hypothetical protein
MRWKVGIQNDTGSSARIGLRHPLLSVLLLTAVQPPLGEDLLDAVRSGDANRVRTHLATTPTAVGSRAGARTVGSGG